MLVRDRRKEKASFILVCVLAIFAASKSSFDSYRIFTHGIIYEAEIAKENFKYKSNDVNSIVRYDYLVRVSDRFYNVDLEEKKELKSQIHIVCLKGSDDCFVGHEEGVKESAINNLWPVVPISILVLLVCSMLLYSYRFKSSKR